MRVIVAILLVAIFAGCTDATPEADPDRILNDREGYLADHYCVKNDIDRVYAPDESGNPWVIGDTWVYRLTTNGESDDVRMVYYEDQDFANGQAQHYMVGTDNREDALEHALFSTNPVLGRIHRALYSPHESGVHADMFNFPLCQGNTWTTKFFDTTFSMRAVRQGDDFLLTGTDGQSRITYTYSPQAKWFTRLDLDRGDGLELAMELLELDTETSGTYYFLRGQKEQTIDLGEQAPTFTFERGTGGEGDYDTLGLFIDVARSQGGQEVIMEVVDPAGNVQHTITIDGQVIGGSPAAADPEMLEVPWMEGDWTVRVTKGPFDEIDGEMIVASIYDRSGSI